jgi:hypothetical protein
MKEFDEQPEEGLVWIYWGSKEQPKKTLCYWRDGYARDMHFGICELDYINGSRKGWKAYK